MVLSRGRDVKETTQNTEAAQKRRGETNKQETGVGERRGVGSGGALMDVLGRQCAGWIS